MKAPTHVRIVQLPKARRIRVYDWAVAAGLGLTIIGIPFAGLYMMYRLLQHQAYKEETNNA